MMNRSRHRIAGMDSFPCFTITLTVAATFFCGCGVQPAAGGESIAIIIDHRCTDLSRVPERWIAAAKQQYRASYGHTSHGSQVVTGMDLLAGTPGSLYWFDYDGTNGGLSLHDGTPAGDLGNPDRTEWAVRTRAMLDSPTNTRNLVLWSWCGQVDGTEAEIQLYLDLMNQLEMDYPKVTFVYMTGHLDGTGETGNVNVRNNQIRDFCRNHGKVLFDFADIESYDPDLNEYMTRGADDGCYYLDDGVRKNWAIDWCSDHPGHSLCTSCSCAHSEPLNCNLKGRAFWWMMARLAGWNGHRTADLDGDTDVDQTDFGQFIPCLGFEETPLSQAACSMTDLNNDGVVDTLDLDILVTCSSGPAILARIECRE